MPSFDLINKVELFVRKGTFPADASKSSKTVVRAASKHFVYKDGCLWRTYRGRLLKVVRSDEEVREILTRYHDDNNHAGRDRTVREIMMMYYWVGVTEAVKTWVRACPACQSRGPTEPPNPPVRFCLAYGCDASSYVNPELRFFRFPKEAEQRQVWLTAAQRDEGSLRSNSFLCSRHFESSCLAPSEGGQPTLAPGAVPTVVTVTAEEDEATSQLVPIPSEEDFLCSNSLEDLLSSAAAASDRSQVPAQLQEHQYCLPAPAADPREFQPVGEEQRRKTVLEPSFSTYNQIARYLSHRVLPMQSKKSRVALKRMAKRFGLKDGVLMFTRVSPPLRVPRSREEVNAVLRQFHDNQGHYGQGICQQEITKHFYWSSMSRDLASWISSCHACLTRTKRKWLRCSIRSCNHCCGPVERGLGLAFHKFPLHDPALLARWLKAVGRAHWHPRLGSSICSTHFTEDCFDRSGERVALRPDAVPTLLVHNSSAALFAKYDAVELYLRQRTYPHGLSYVEKNTFRRFCKKFVIKGDELHLAKGERLRLVLRSRQQVEVALEDYHNELNHLDANKCLRLLNERFFWKTMRPDVVQWISGCPGCSGRTGNPERQATAAGSESPPRIHRDVDSDTDDAEEEEEGDGGGGDEELPEPEVDHGESPGPAAPITPQPGTRVRSIQGGKRSPAGVQKESGGARDCPEEQTRDPQGSARTQRYVREPPPPDDPAHPPRATTDHIQPVCPNSQSQTTTETQAGGAGAGAQRPAKRSRDVEANGTSSGGLEPVAAPSTKPWPVFTIAGSAPAHTAKRPPGGDSPALCRGPRTLQARTIVQQCSQAKVRVKPAVDGGAAEWAEIQEGMVVYVSFSRGATEDVSDEIANTLMTTKLFRRDTRHWVSVLDLPGSVLLIPQDSLLGEPLPRRKMRLSGGCEPWRGARLFSNLVFTCKELLRRSARCTEAGAKVEQGVYGQKQEMVLSCVEPQTVLLEF